MFKLHNLIFLGMLLGVAVGYGLWHVKQASLAASLPVPWWHAHVIWWLDLFGPTIFMGALKMIIAPLILASIVAGVTSLSNIRELGAIGWKTIVYFFLTTGLAAIVGLVCVTVIEPGKQPASQKTRAEYEQKQGEIRAEFEQARGEAAFDEAGRPLPQYLALLAERRGERVIGEDAERLRKLSMAKERTPGDVIKQDLVAPLFMNPFESLVTRNSLGIIFFAVMFGVACTLLGRRAERIIGFFQDLNAVIMQVTHWLMSISPFAISCIVANLVAEHGPNVFGTLGWYCGTILLAIGIQVVILVLICWFFGRVGPVTLWRGYREALMIAFTTRSSAATLPVSIANVTEKLNVSPKVANFAMPLGATINMNGTALYEGIAIVFLLQMFVGLDDVPHDLDAATTLLVFTTAVVAAVGAAAVPDAGLITMVLVAIAVRLPVYYIPIIFAVDAFLDMFRTSTNILGDAVGSIVVNRLERGRLNGGEGTATT